jgi:hypothetical protein
VCFGLLLCGDRCTFTSSWNFVAVADDVQKFAAKNGILFPGDTTSLQDGPFYQTAEKHFNVQTCPT